MAYDDQIHAEIQIGTRDPRTKTGTGPKKFKISDRSNKIMKITDQLGPISPRTLRSLTCTQIAR